MQVIFAILWMTMVELWMKMNFYFGGRREKFMAMDDCLRAWATLPQRALPKISNFPFSPQVSNH